MWTGTKAARQSAWRYFVILSLAFHWTMHWVVFCLIFADASRSLKAERNSNQRAHAAMLSHVNEQKDESEKNLRETNLKLTSLQQHFKLLKSEHDDAMEACAKAKAKHLDEINALQRKLQGMETYGGQTVKEKDKLIELLKVSNDTDCCLLSFWEIDSYDILYFVRQKTPNCSTTKPYWRKWWTRRISPCPNCHRKSTDFSIKSNNTKSIPHGDHRRSMTQRRRHLAPSIKWNTHKMCKQIVHPTINMI